MTRPSSTKLSVPPSQTITLRVRIKGLRADVPSGEIAMIVKESICQNEIADLKQITVTIPKPRAPKVVTPESTDFWERMRQRFPRVNVEAQSQLMDRWLASPKGVGRYKSEAFVTRWLAKAEAEARTVPALPVSRPTPVEDWRTRDAQARAAAAQERAHRQLLQHDFRSDPWEFVDACSAIVGEPATCCGRPKVEHPNIAAQERAQRQRKEA